MAVLPPWLVSVVLGATAGWAFPFYGDVTPVIRGDHTSIYLITIEADTIPNL